MFQHTLETVILAGGNSRRMGQDKARILIQGKPLLQQLCSVAIACTERVSVVTPWPERYQALLPPQCRLIHESRDSQESVAPGPLWGLAQATKAIEAEWTLVLACDLPRLQPEMIQKWRSQLTDLPPTAFALLPRHPKGWEPLCGFYHRRCFPSLIAFVAQGGRSFQPWLKTLSVAELTVGDRRCLWNCNTPKDLEDLRALGY